MNKSVPEGAIAKVIRDYLNRRGYTVWRNNTGFYRILRFNGTTGMMSNGMKGSPDVIGFTPEGRFLGIEVKRQGEKLTPLQSRFAKRLRETKYGIYIVARSIEDVQVQLEGIKQEKLL